MKKTFRDVVALYANDNNPEWSNLAPRSREIYRSGLKYLEPFYDVEVKKITRPMVIEFRDSLYKMSGMCRIALVCLSNVLRYAHDRGMVEYNQAANIRGLPEPKGIQRWTNKEINRCLETAPERLKQAVILALYTGQRRSDLVRMLWKDYNGEYIRVKQMKTSKLLDIPVHPVLKEMLDAMPRKKGHILLNFYGEPWVADTLRSAIKSHLMSLGIENRSIHGLRKAAAANLAEVGCTPHQIQAITGHASLKEIENYTKEADQKRLAKEAINKWKTVTL